MCIACLVQSLSGSCVLRAQVLGKSKSGLWNVSLGVKAEDGDKTLKTATDVATTCVEKGLHAAFSDFDGDLCSCYH